MPVTRWLNKHLIPVGHGDLMIDLPLRFLAAHAFDEVTVVTGSNHAAQIVEHIGDGSQYGFKRVDYAFQPKPAGIADILNRVSHSDTEEGILLILGDNYFSDIQTNIFHLGDYSNFAAAWEYDIGDPELARRFGQYITDGEIGRIVEKPQIPIHGRILTGLYYFPSDVFERVKRLLPSARNELEITDLLSLYLDEWKLSVYDVEGDWCDLGEITTWQNFVASRK